MILKKNIVYVSPSYIQDRLSLREAAEQLDTELNVSFNSVSSIQELFPLISDPKYLVDLILIDIEKFYETSGADMFDIIHTLSTLINCTVCRVGPGKPTKRDTVIGAVADINTDPKLIRNLITTGVRGIYPRGAEFTIEEKSRALADVLNKQSHIPKKIHELIKLKKKKVDEPSRNASISLTPRQEQIVNLIRDRGASNKVIARMLNLSESTVKLHITAVFKKFGVKNRTQLALFVPS